MEFADVVLRRRMVRNYTTEPVDPAVVDRILEHALHAPSAGFSQGWAFLRLDTPDDIQRFWDAATPPGRGTDSWSEGLRRAPVIVVPMSSKQAYLDRYAEADKGWTDRDESRWPAPYWDIDTGMATLLMLLTAVDEGLGACFFGIPPERIPAFRETFGVPEQYTPIGATTIGHRAPDRGSPSLRRGRRGREDVVHRGHWNRPSSRD
ncbi:nitroreductase family protein [Actinobacteria bacterium YIM 96077]|uniref:Nitroreductase family protein n=1 Tax=Phytoactinopolyspora halophila TaxID=1981511 RepID=A0A329R0J5_9ACTN|nr:nitroreductase family protein [Phytoactinopolyspora halophila]AYY15119.1 nitroreductase family protein [Actinobacteria bacterium YIM 96077]RAW18121.1 nitroreductase family protein [Phytoactinopolyspora halophila]